MNLPPLKQGIVLDTNLTVLLCVGMAGRQHIGRHKRLAAYDATDFDLLGLVLSRATRLVLSPNVATETSNLLRQSAEPMRSLVALALRALVGEGR